MSNMDFTDGFPCAEVSAKLFPILTGPFKFVRPVIDTTPDTSITIEFFWVGPFPVWNVIKLGEVMPNPPDESCSPRVVVAPVTVR